MTTYVWEDLTTTELSALDKENAVAVLPVAAIEQHGPHLPLGTDAIIADAIVDTALASLSASVVALRLPTQRIGTSDEHASFPGTLTLPAETLLAAWVAIGHGIARAGVRRLVLVNSHGGQPQIVDLVGLRLRREARMLVVRANLFAFDLPDGLIAGDERRFGFHGGEIETSLMLHVAPNLVRRDQVRDFPSTSTEIVTTSALLEAEGEVGFAWLAEDLNPDGPTGDASRATAETGARLLDHQARKLAAAIEDAATFPLERLR